MEDLTSQSFKLNQEEAVQLENFLNLLVELKIIDSSEPVSLILPIEIDKNKDLSTREIELLQSPVQFQISATPSISSVINWEVTLEDPQIPTSLPSSQEHSTETANQNINKPNLDKSEDEIAALQKLQELLIGHELADLYSLSASLQQDLTKLEHQIYDPQELINLLLPWITELLRLKITDSKEDIVQAITPIVDQAISSRVEQDKASMGLALASAVPLAISQQINIAPEEVAEAIAPTMGRAMKKQIEIEQDTVVDALYPIIGSTITKYMAETINAINQQIENTLSVEGIKRKIRAKLQGVSEAELILKEALTFTVEAIFLIHKASGLVICDIQHSDTLRLESEMLAGMLTAIRSFANDCITQSGRVSELDAIDYGTSKIVLEVAGYCYLAIIVQGKPTKAFMWKMRQTLVKVVKDYGKLVEQFDGDSATIPSQIKTLLETLKNEYNQAKKRKNQPSPLLLLSLTLLSAIIIPWGVWQYQSEVIRNFENKIALALASSPDLAIYLLTVKSNHDTLKLTGRVPNQLLRFKAEQIVKAYAPKWLIDNQIIAVEVPADQVQTAAEVKRIIAVLNQMDGITIAAQYKAGKVSVIGTVSQIADAKTIQKAFEQIPGVKYVSSAVVVKPLRIEVRFYFEPNSIVLTSRESKNKIRQVILFLNQHPLKHLKIMGYSYNSSNASAAQQLALERAKAVQQTLINQSIDPSRLHVMETTKLPEEIDFTQPSWFRRCVVLETIP